MGFPARDCSVLPLFKVGTTSAGHRLRRLNRAVLWAWIADPAEIEEEIRDLFAALGS